jgi:hypothetical protein
MDVHIFEVVSDNLKLSKWRGVDFLEWGVSNNLVEGSNDISGELDGF